MVMIETYGSSFDKSGYFFLDICRTNVNIGVSVIVCTTLLPQATRGCHCSTVAKMSCPFQRVSHMSTFCRNLKKEVKSENTSL